MSNTPRKFFRPDYRGSPSVIENTIRTRLSCNGAAASAHIYNGQCTSMQIRFVRFYTRDGVIANRWGEYRGSVCERIVHWALRPCRAKNGRPIIRRRPRASWKRRTGGGGGVRSLLRKYALAFNLKQNSGSLCHCRRVGAMYVSIRVAKIDWNPTRVTLNRRAITGRNGLR